jgi:hypothetical protein
MKQEKKDMNGLVERLRMKHLPPMVFYKEGCYFTKVNRKTVRKT